MKSIIDIPDLSVKEIDELIAVAADIVDHPQKYAKACEGKKLATLFYEPSTRTRLSFTAAMMELGGNVLGFSEPGSSSAVKGESIADTARVVACYADIIAMRSPKEGAAFIAAENAGIPVINTGDGGHAHPTQTLGDLFTIYREKGHFDNLTVGFCGDLKYGRTVHSLIEAMSRYPGVRFVLISPDELKLPTFVRYETLARHNVAYKETKSLDEAMPELDILYMTRIQKERFADVNQYDRLKDSYILTEEKLKNAKADLCIMHPLPRVNEISVKVDKAPRACYFKQVKNGKYMRMALILKLLDEAEKNPEPENLLTGRKVLINEIHCDNPHCVTATEQELDDIFRVVDEKAGICRCIYCERKVRADAEMMKRARQG